jgi:hypothetical protein
MLSMALILVVFSLVMGDRHLRPPLYPLFLKSARVAFGIFAVVCAAGVFASLRRGDVRRASTARYHPPGGRAR